MKANADIWAALKSAGVRQWEVAEFLGCSEQTMIRHMRRELPSAERERVYRAIDAISTKRAELEAM